MMFTVRYIFHDCFLLMTDDCNIVFDYWQPCYDAQAEFPSFLDSLDTEKPLIVVVSHHHKDHFTRDIFRWGSRFAGIHFVISKDTARYCRHLLRPDSLYKGQKPDPASVTVISPGETARIGSISIKAYSSTDTGNSYCVMADRHRFFHAGDLNAWIWKDESTQEEVDREISRFSTILDTIAADGTHFDAAMFPVDARIGRDYFTGAGMFVRKFEIDRFFPMHFSLGTDSDTRRKYESAAARFDLYANPQHGEYIFLSAPGDSLTFC